MFKISLILLAAWGGFWATSAASMEGGTVLTNPVLYSHLAHIRKGASGAGDFKCLGVVLSSVMVYTSNYCELTQANSKDYHIDASFSNKDPMASTGVVANVYEGKHMNDFKQITLELPGLQLGLPSSESNSTDGIRASPFNDEETVDFASMTLVALAFDGKDFKAGSVAIMMNDTECSLLYGMATKKNPDMPVNLTENLLCATKAANQTKYTLFDVAMDVEPGMPCDDSLGSPVMGPSNRTMGIIVKAFCDPDLKVAFIQPVLKPDTGLKPDVPDATDNETSTTEGVYTGTYVPVTGLSPRKPKTYRSNPTLLPTSHANTVINQLTVWCFVVALGIISAV